MIRPRLCVIGDALLDVDWDGDVQRVCRDAPAPVVDSPTERMRPGGAALAATLSADAGVDNDPRDRAVRDGDGRRLARLLAAAGVTVVDLGLDGPTPVKLRLRSGGQSLAACRPGLRPRGAAGPVDRRRRRGGLRRRRGPGVGLRPRAGRPARGLGHTLDRARRATGGVGPAQRGTAAAGHGDAGDAQRRRSARARGDAGVHGRERARSPTSSSWRRRCRPRWGARSPSPRATVARCWPSPPPPSPSSCRPVPPVATHAAPETPSPPTSPSPWRPARAAARRWRSASWLPVRTSRAARPGRRP